MENYADSLLSQTELLLMSAWYAREFNALFDPEGFLFCLTAMSEGYTTIEWHPQAARFKYNRFNTLKQSHIFRVRSPRLSFSRPLCCVIPRIGYYLCCVFCSAT